MTTSLRTGLGLLVALLVLAVNSSQLIAQDAPKQPAKQPPGSADAADAAQQPPMAEGNSLPMMKKAEGGFANGDVPIFNPDEVIMIPDLPDEERQRLNDLADRAFASNITHIGGWNVWWFIAFWMLSQCILVHHARRK